MCIPVFRTPAFSTWVAGFVVAIPSGLFDIGTLADLSNIGTLFAFVLVSVGVIVLRYREPDRRRGFRVPFGPIIPALSVIFCFLLMAGLPIITWLRFLIWLAIGLVIYFLYSRHRSEFATYSFLILAYNKVGPFMAQVEELRRKHGLIKPYSEFAFKDLSFGPRSRALPEFLRLVDNFIHGAVITIAIDKQIDTVFGVSKRETYPLMEQQLAAMGFGKWRGAAAEKVLRVCHSIAIFTALTTKENQRLLWYCDNDVINENAQDRRFEDTQNIFVRALGMYCKHRFDLVGFGKSFDDKSHLDDLLSIPDLAAGVVQDLLQAHKTGEDNVPGGEEKKALLRWIATQGKFLSKITIQIIRLPNGELGSRVVEFTPVKPNSE
jgi:hypothetical protein